MVVGMLPHMNRHAPTCWQASGYKFTEYILDVANILDLIIVFGQIFVNMCVELEA